MLRVCASIVFVLHFKKYVTNAIGIDEPPFWKRCGRVHITVSSLDDTYLELNWITKCDQSNDVQPDEIALYDHDPNDRNDDVPARVKILAKSYPDGYFKTKVKFGHPWLPGNWEYQENFTRGDPGPHCFPYWIASFKRDSIIHSQCLSIHPTWMSDNSLKMGLQRMGTIFIPGTHNSATYPIIPFFQNYIMNQDRNVWTQLVFGIRYLDLRVGYYEKEGFFINHDVVRISPLAPILKEIRKFSEAAPREIIVIDFHRFPYPKNFNPNIHRKLVSLIYEELGSLALSPSGLQSGRGPTIHEIWQRNKSLIISYGNKEIAREYDWLWNPLQQYWGDKRNPSDLKSFLLTSIQQHKTILNPMWALMAELTPQTIDIIFRTNSLRKLADNVNRHVTKWFRDEWSQNVNIVASDFFLGNDLINVAILSNIFR